MIVLSPADAAQRLSTALRERKAIPPREIEPALTGWECFDVRGAVVMRKGPELHAAAPAGVRGHWITRAGMREIVVDTLRRYGFAITSVQRDNAPGHAFVKRIGFIPCGESRESISYVLWECRHA